MPKPIIIICGPTASGKTQLSLSLAQKHDSVIINADSMQLYKEIPIISAQPSAEEQKTAPHKLFGVVPIIETCSVAKWIDWACKGINRAHDSNKLPILVGGTGMYLSSLIEGLSEIPPIDEEIKKHSRQLLDSIGNQEFHKKLALTDAESAKKLNINDTHRLLRAYDVVLQTGKTLSHWQNKPKKRFYDEDQFQCFFVNPPRETLYDNCNKRFDLMLSSGLMDEVKTIHKMDLSPDLTGMKALGLRELLAHLEGIMNYETAIEKAKIVTRRYAKRQITWFKHQMEYVEIINNPYQFNTPNITLTD